MRLLFTIILSILLTFSPVYSQQLSLMDDEQSCRSMLDQRIGNWTYDDAIELFGSPIFITKGVEVIVAEWKETGTHMTNIHGTPWIAKNEWQLKISFRKIDGLMVSYNLRFIVDEPL